MEKPPTERADPESGSLGGNHPTTISYWKLLTDQGVLTQAMVDYDYEGSGTEEDPYVVEWMDNDPRNPMTWGSVKKWVMAVMMAVATLAVAFCSSAYSGGIAHIMGEFETTQTIAVLGVSLFVLGFALGPLIWAPCSELYGRQIVFFGTYAAFVVFNAGAAGSQNIETLIVLRFLSGAFGSSPLTNAGGVVADLFNAKERGLALAVFSSAPFMGPVLGPVVGGFLGMTEGWRWIQGVMAIFSGVVFFISILIVPETYPPTLMRQRGVALSKLTGKVYRSQADITQGQTTVGEAFSTGMKTPWILLFTEPIVLLLSIYMAVIYGTLYMLFGAFPVVYGTERGWNAGVAGLPFCGVAIGIIFALVYTFSIDNKRYARCMQKSPTGRAAPEDRLHGLLVGGITLPIGLFWFAWTNYPSMPWQASVAAAIPFGFGMVLIFLGVMNYLIDAYTIFAASVLAGSGVLRSLFGFAFPMFTVQMYASLGIHWASMIPACLSLVCVIFPFVLLRYGKAIRAKCNYAAKSEAFMNDMHAKVAASQAAIAAENAEHDGGSNTSSMTAVMHTNGREGAEGDAAAVEENQFEEIKTGHEAHHMLDRTKSGHSARSTRSVREQDLFPDNPYAIDRVNTRESFGRKRTSSVKSRR